MNNELGTKASDNVSGSRNSKLRLGELLVELGLIDALGLSQLLSVASETGLAFGRVAIMSDTLSEFDLKNVLRCQNLLKDGLIDITQARKALEFSRRNNEEIDESLFHLGLKPAPGDNLVQLGELLLSAQYVTPQQLAVALAQHEKTDLPLGRVLVLSGVLTEGLLTTAINAQILVRDHKLDRAQAIESLTQAKIRQIPIEMAAREKGFYELPNRTLPRLGELLTIAEIINDTQLANALEVSLASKQPVGEVLIESGLLKREILESALVVQKMIGEGAVRVAEAKSILLAIKHGQRLEDALRRFEQLKLEVKTGVPPLVSMLKLFGCIDDVDVIKAFSVAQHDTQVISQVLLVGGAVDEETLVRAQGCRQLIESGRLTMEHASILFDYSQKRHIDLDTALEELQWQSGGKGESETQGNALEPTDLGEQQFQEARAAAARMVASHQYEQARELLLRLSKAVENQNDEHYFECLDAVAETYMLEQNLQFALSYYTQSLDGKRSKYGSNSLVAAFALNNTGKVAYFQKRFAASEECAREYIKICSSILGAKHPHVACGWQNIATVYHIQEKYSQAEHAYKTALDICSSNLGDGHPTTVRLNRSYANLLHVMDKVKDAQKIDSFAQGTISGNWFAIDLPPDQNLLEP
ncbi:MAG: tetratricopeptide repeat protein [Candidatus Obscuribacterales bacterium]|nr:tetratricopeptide repeat protein [Candidatus Obscuribacterales bacterium]